jgi:CBS domain-containing protein
VSDVMTSRVHIANRQSPFKQLVRVIEENHISAIPVVDERGFPVGIVSEADLLLKSRRHELEGERGVRHLQRRRAQRSKAEGTTAEEVMTAPPITVQVDVTLSEAARLMQERNVRRLVVVDRAGKIAGIVSRSDLLQVFLRGDDEIKREILDEVVPAVLVDGVSHDVRVDVRWNVVTLSGIVDRRSDAEILTRVVGELDGVVNVTDKLEYRWDDRAPEDEQPVSVMAAFKAF